ncbi:aldo/keto reductase [archaeon]|nr:aldo/keto reductase [archaeon]
MPYGIANKSGRPDLKTAVEIIDTAWNSGIREFDTAQAYGESEAVLGKALTSLGLWNQCRIITKPDPKMDPRQPELLKESLRGSLTRLNILSLYGFMLHREEWIDSLDDGLGELLQELVCDGMVQHIGVSLYSPRRAHQAISCGIFDMIQVPANILDRRFLSEGIFEKDVNRGMQIYVRSVFLQGLLLMEGDAIPENMVFARDVIISLEELCRQYDVDRRQVALGYVRQKYPDAKIVFGAESVQQVRQNAGFWRGEPPDALINELDNIYGSVDDRILDPTRWPK